MKNGFLEQLVRGREEGGERKKFDIYKEEEEEEEKHPQLGDD